MWWQYILLSFFMLFVVLIVYGFYGEIKVENESKENTRRIRRAYMQEFRGYPEDRLSAWNRTIDRLEDEGADEMLISEAQMEAHLSRGKDVEPIFDINPN